MSRPYDSYRICAECGAEFTDTYEYVGHALDHILTDEWYAMDVDLIREKPQESSRVRGLRAMANQDTSPHERDIARTKLKEMGLWTDT